MVYNKLDRMMMRPLVILALLLAPPAHAAVGRVVKVLPQFLDKKGRNSLSPSFYERDAYQFFLRKHPEERAALRLAVQWKAKDVDWTTLKLRAEMRGLVGDSTHTVTLEEPAVKNGHFSNWSEFKIQGVPFRDFGQLVAWRVTLWQGDHQLGELDSFLWSPLR